MGHKRDRLVGDQETKEIIRTATREKSQGGIKRIRRKKESFSSENVKMVHVNARWRLERSYSRNAEFKIEFLGSPR